MLGGKQGQRGFRVVRLSLSDRENATKDCREAKVRCYAPPPAQEQPSGLERDGLAEGDGADGAGGCLPLVDTSLPLVKLLL